MTIYICTFCVHTLPLHVFYISHILHDNIPSLMNYIQKKLLVCCLICQVCKTDVIRVSHVWKKKLCQRN